MLWRCHVRRVLHWTLFALVTIIIWLAPLIGDRHCVLDLENWKDAVDDGTGLSSRSWILRGRANGIPPFGTHYCFVGVASVLLAILSEPNGRFGAKKKMHLWTRRYIFCIVMLAATKVGMAWSFAVCPSPDGTIALFAVFVTLGAMAYLFSLAILSYMVVLRLQLVVSSHASAWTARALKLVVLLSIVLAISWGVAHYDQDLNGHVLNVILPCWLLSYVFFQIVCLASLVVRILQARREAQFKNISAIESRKSDRSSVSTRRRFSRNLITFSTTSKEERAATVILLMMVLLVCSTGSTVLFFAMVSLHSRYDCSTCNIPAALTFASELCTSIDVSFNAGLAVFSAGLIGPADDQLDRLNVIKDLLVERRERLIREQLRKLGKETSGTALAIAALMEGQDTDTILTKAIDRFRCISWTTLREKPEIIIDGGTLDVVGAAPGSIYELSEPCGLSECDAFVSHSWQDNGQQKWKALCAWCERFAESNGRAPRLWLDKCCIDQANIDADLPCLPVFLAGCNTTLIMSGLTFTSRLWCCMEIFVAVNMLIDSDTETQLPTIITLGEKPEDHTCARETWCSFSTAKCKCYSESDKERLLAVINRFPGGSHEFDEHVRSLSERLGMSSEFPSDSVHLDVARLGVRSLGVSSELPVESIHLDLVPLESEVVYVPPTQVNTSRWHMPISL